MSGTSIAAEPDSHPEQIRREVPARYGTSQVDVTAWDDRDAAMITLRHVGVTASISLSHAQLAGVRDAINAVLVTAGPVPEGATS